MADDEIQTAVDVLESGYLVQGEQVEEFEAEFASTVGVDHAIAVSSGTAALHVAYLAVLDEGSEVLVPSMSHIATASMVLFADCEPVFCDVDERRYTLDIASARERLTDDTTALTPVHLFGNACDVSELTTFAREHDLSLFWDASQAHGTTYDGVDIGGVDDVVTYSFYPTKNMTTTEGGMITTNDDKIAKRCRLLRSHWQTEKYYHPQAGLNYRMTDVEAAIGRKQLEKLGDFVARRRENGETLTAGLEGIDEITTPYVPSEVEHSYHQYTIQVDFESLSCDRDGFRKTLESRGIDTAVHYPRPLHQQPAFDTDITLPVSERLSERVLSLPVYPTLDGDELERIVDRVAATVEQYRN